MALKFEGKSRQELLEIARRQNSALDLYREAFPSSVKLADLTIKIVGSQEDISKNILKAFGLGCLFISLAFAYAVVNYAMI